MIGGNLVSREGFIELRVFRGLGDATIMDPSQAAGMTTGWSNVLRIPVVVPTAPPVIKSVSKSKFFIGGGNPSDYRLVIDAEGVDGRGEVTLRFNRIGRDVDVPAEY
jgi:hypothetical protein